MTQLFLTQPTVERSVISHQTSELMREALESVVANGGGRLAFLDGYRVGGKSGTAKELLMAAILRMNTYCHL